MTEYRMNHLTRMNHWTPNENASHEFNLDTLQQRLQRVTDTARESWTYAIFWESSVLEYSGPPVLGWGDGYYEGEQNKSKTVMSATSLAVQQYRKKVLRELNSMISGTQAPENDAVDEEVTDTEWFFLISMTQSFVNGVGLPGQAMVSNQPVWVAGGERLMTSHCERARQAQGFGLQTIVCIPSAHGVIELGSTELIYQSSDIMNKVRGSFNFSDFNHGQGNLSNELFYYIQALRGGTHSYSLEQGSCYIHDGNLSHEVGGVSGQAPSIGDMVWENMSPGSTHSYSHDGSAPSWNDLFKRDSSTTMTESDNLQDISWELEFEQMTIFENDNFDFFKRDSSTTMTESDNLQDISRELEVLQTIFEKNFVACLSATHVRALVGQVRALSGQKACHIIL